MRLLRLLRTSTFRLALIYVALFGGSVLILLGFIYWATAGYIARQTDETIAADITGLAEQYRQRGLDGLATTITQRVARNPQGSTIYLLAEPGFRRIAGNIDRWPPVPQDSDGWLTFTVQDRESARGEAYQARARHFVLSGDFNLLVGRDVQERRALQELIVESLAWGLAITLALALVGGLLMSWSMVQRIEAINRTSQEIMQGELARRIPTTGTGDDFDQLAHNLNSMLDQIESLMAGIRQISDNIAHDLRSPLMRLRSRIEIARRPQPDAEQHRALIDAIAAEADTLLSIFSALLRIAEIEAGNRRAGFANVDLSAVARDAAELYEPVAQDQHQTFEARIEPEVHVHGDRHLLSQALTNLIDNAIKYTPEGGTIQVELRGAADGADLTVADTGPGVPPEYRDRVLQRFFRLEASRSTPGSGLGLSLVAAVAKLHNAELKLLDNHPGLRAVLSFRALPRS